MSIIDDNARFEEDDKAIMEALGIEPQDPNAIPPEFSREDRPEVEPADMPEVSILDLVEANYEAIKVVFSAALAQLLGGDPLTAKTVFTKFTEDVDRERQRYIMLKVEIAQAVDGVVAEVVDEEK